MDELHNTTPGVSSTSGNPLADFVRDSKQALRAMRRAPVFAFFAVLTLGLGIGASTTVFTIVNTLLLHPLPARDPSGLVALYTNSFEGGPAGTRSASGHPI